MGMTPDLCQQLMLAILDDSADWEAHGSDLASFLSAHPTQA
jgi:hypothetical protein